MSMLGSGELERRFQDEVRGLLGQRCIVAFFVGAMIFPTFVFQDLMLVPDRWREMLVLRLASGLICILGIAMMKTPLGARRPFEIGMTALVGLVLIKTFITPLRVEGLEAMYYGGHVLIMVGAMAYLPLSLGRAVAVLLICQLGYSIPMMVFGTRINPVGFSIQNTYLLSIGSMLVVGCHLNYQMRRREFRLRSRLYSARIRTEDYG